jgi:hypothetical protein
MLNKYVVTYNDTENLFDPYKTIEGKNPKDALKKAFNKDYERLTGDRGRYANIILVKGEFDKENNSIIYNGRYQRLCYGIIK